MKLEVPYYSQYLDIDDNYWMPRACGICCLKMVLGVYGKKTGDIKNMCRAGQAEGGYGKSGWIHEYLVTIARRRGLSAHHEEKMDEFTGLKKILTSLNNSEPVIISVSKLSLGQSKFHMVVLTGYEDGIDGVPRGFYFHDPESLDRETGQYIFVDMEDFKKSWRKMAIFVAPSL
ncbi:MAG: C39 family peptidase [Patescibacteria group bacterium]